MDNLTNFKENIIWRGAILKCKGKYPYEDVVYFLVCEIQETYALVIISGYKAGLIYTYFPKESIPDGCRLGLSSDWLKTNWNKWGLYWLQYRRCLYKQYVRSVGVNTRCWNRKTLL